jgi:hypothetical protein
MHTWNLIGNRVRIKVKITANTMRSKESAQQARAAASNMRQSRLRSKRLLTRRSVATDTPSEIHAAADTAMAARVGSGRGISSSCKTTAKEGTVKANSPHRATTPRPAAEVRSQLGSSVCTSSVVLARVIIYLKGCLTVLRHPSFHEAHPSLAAYTRSWLPSLAWQLSEGSVLVSSEWCLGRLPDWRRVPAA